MLMGFITGDRVNGAARWMTFMGIQFQPSEIAKMAVVIVTAFILSKGQDEDGASPKAFKRIMIITCIVCGPYPARKTTRRECCSSERST